jgi:hypothetical protein
MRGKIIHYNAGDGKGLILAEERQIAFGIGQWSSEIGPAVNQTVELSLDEDDSPSRITIVDAQTLAKEKISQFASMGGDHSQQAAIQGKAVFAQVVSRMGKVLAIVCAVLFIAWFFLPALSINAGFGEAKNFTVSEILGVNLSPIGVVSSFGFWSFLGLVAVVLPWLAPRLQARWAPLLNTAPLLMILMAYIHVRLQIQSLVSNALGAAGEMGGAEAQSMINGAMDQMSSTVGNAVSLDFGFWVVVILSLYLAVIGLLGFLRRPASPTMSAH